MVGTTGEGKTPYSDRVAATEKQVIEACEFIGYGRVMQIAGSAWQKKAKEENREGMGFVLGPHSGEVVSCGCNSEEECNWCCGTGWLTKHVKSIKEA